MHKKDSVNSYLQSWTQSIDRRKKLYPEKFNGEQCLRVIHDDGTPLRADLLGEVLQLGWWSDSVQGIPTEEQIKRLMDLTGARHYALTFHSKNIHEKKKFPGSLAQDSWVAKENNIRYLFYRDQGVSPGLFLDQRSQRQWVQENSKDKKVLNLFCYTAGFSLNAARGDAEQVVSVDLSSKYVDWSKKNFELNEFVITRERFRFYDMDSFEYLKWAIKKNETYDIIICDPPSFSRNKNKIFKIETDYVELLSLMVKCLNPHGTILFSTNYETWSWKKWLEKIREVVQPFYLSVKANYNTELDFEADPQQSIMKAFQISDSFVDNRVISR